MRNHETPGHNRSSRLGIRIAVVVALIALGGEGVVRTLLDDEFYAKRLSSRAGIADVRFEGVTTSFLGRSVTANEARIVFASPGDTLWVARVRLSGVNWVAFAQGPGAANRLHATEVRARHGAYQFEVASADVRLDVGSVRCQGVRYAPILPTESQLHEGASQAFDLATETIEIEGADLRGWLRGEPLTAKSLALTGFSADVRCDKNFSGEPSPKTMPNAYVARTRPPVRIDRIEVRGRASYSERPADLDDFGTLAFESIILMGGPVQSDDPGLFTTFDIESRVNDEIPLSTTFRWRAAAPSLDLHIRGEASIEDPSTLNAMFVPVSGILVSSGTFETLSFQYVLSDRSARGWFDAVYDSLVVRAVEPTDSTDTRRITDWFLARKIRTSHVPGRDPPRSGEIAYERDEWNGFFAFVWFSLRTGIQAMVLD